MTTTRSNLLILMAAMFLGAVLGGILGYSAPDFMLSLSVLGQLFLGALKLILIPLIISVIVVGVSSLGDLRRLGRAGRTTMLYFLGSSAAAVIVGLVLAYVVQPGLNSARSASAPYVRTHEALNSGLSDVFSALAPVNMLQSIAQGQYLGLVVLALLFGAVLATMGKRAAVVVGFFKVISEASLKLVSVLLYAAPLGLFVLVGSAVASEPDLMGQLSGNLFVLGLTLLGGILIHGLIILPLILKFFGGQGPGRLVANLGSALLTALGTGSSAATLPVTYDGVVEQHKVDSRAGSLVLPLGTMINLNGTAMYLVIAAIFVAQAAGVSLSAFDYILVGLLALVLSLGASGVAAPATGPFMLAMLIGAVNFPVAAFAVVAVLVVVEVLFERLRAVLNVWGNVVGAVVVGESFEFKTARGITPSNRGERSSYDRSQRGTRSGFDRDRQAGRDQRRDDSRTQDNRPPRPRTGDRGRPAGDRRSSEGRPSRGGGTIPDRPDRPTGRPQRPDSRNEQRPRNGRPPQDQPSRPAPRPSSKPAPPKSPLPVSQAENKRKPLFSPPVVKTDRPAPRDRNSSGPDRSPRPEPLTPQTEIPAQGLSAETIERERSKIAAQLANMRQEESRAEPSEKSDDTRSPETTPQPSTGTAEAQKTASEVSPVIDFYSGSETVADNAKADEASSHERSPVEDRPAVPEPDKSVADDQVRVEAETAAPDTPIVSAEAGSAREDQDKEMEEKKSDSELATPAFGRTRVSRGPVRDSSSQESSPRAESKPDEDKSAPPAYDTENVSFGRTKRKRTRR